MRKFLRYFWAETKGMFKWFFWGGVVTALLVMWLFSLSNYFYNDLQISLWHGIDEMFSVGFLALFGLVGAGMIMSPLWALMNYMDNRKNL